MTNSTQPEAMLSTLTFVPQEQNRNWPSDEAWKSTRKPCKPSNHQYNCKLQW